MELWDHSELNNIELFVTCYRLFINGRDYSGIGGGACIMIKDPTLICTPPTPRNHIRCYLAFDIS